jgi:outer membrane protein OmpA-like peptidoglycan-associated protein
VIEGHTDSQGNEAVNAELSSARAESVRAALVAKGVAADRLTAVGFGESQPIADNATTEGRAANRRVVFNLTKG